MRSPTTDLHGLLDADYGPDGAVRLRAQLAAGADPDQVAGPLAETALHVAARRRRVEACAILLDHGADINATNGGGKTAYAHTVRRGFDDVVALLHDRGADSTLNDADRLAIAVINGRLPEAHQILAVSPTAVRTGNPEEDRLLADVAGRAESAPVEWLIAAGADLEAPALDGGTPLHQAAWFGQPDNTRLLLKAGAPLERFDPVHGSSPLGWAVHGSRYSGGADQRQDAYVHIVWQLLRAGAELHYPGDARGREYFDRLVADASPAVATILRDVPR